MADLQTLHDGIIRFIAERSGGFFGFWTPDRNVFEWGDGVVVRNVCGPDVLIRSQTDLDAWTNAVKTLDALEWRHR